MSRTETAGDSRAGPNHRVRGPDCHQRWSL